MILIKEESIFVAQLLVEGKWVDTDIKAELGSLNVVKAMIKDSELFQPTPIDNQRIVWRISQMYEDIIYP